MIGGRAVADTFMVPEIEKMACETGSGISKRFEWRSTNATMNMIEKKQQTTVTFVNTVIAA